MPLASTGPAQAVEPGSLVVHWVRPSVRLSAMSCPVVSTTNTLLPATYGGCVPGTVTDQSRSPVLATVATMRPPWPTANTVPLSTAGRAASLMDAIDEVVRERDRLSDHKPLPSATLSATTSPVE